MFKRQQIKQLADKSKMDVLQKEKLVKLEMKQENESVFRANDLASFM